jgi:DNA-binding MarR family transcriptional regulator
MESVDSYVGFDVVRLLLQCHKLEKSLSASAGLSVDEFHCLSQLYVYAPCCVKTLCELAGIHATRASRILNALERKGYLIRTLGIEDKRKETLTLTEAGGGIARSLLQSCALSRRSLAGSLRDDEAQHAASDLSDDYPGVMM